MHSGKQSLLLARSVIGYRRSTPVRGMRSWSHAHCVFSVSISSEHGWSCMQKNAICNVLGGRTNNRPLQPTNGRVISLANIPGSVANN